MINDWSEVERFIVEIFERCGDSTVSESLLHAIASHDHHAYVVVLVLYGVAEEVIASCGDRDRANPIMIRVYQGFNHGARPWRSESRWRARRKVQKLAKWVEDSAARGAMDRGDRSVGLINSVSHFTAPSRAYGS